MNLLSRWLFGIVLSCALLSGQTVLAKTLVDTDSAQELTNKKNVQPAVYNVAYYGAVCSSVVSQTAAIQAAIAAAGGDGGGMVVFDSCIYALGTGLTNTYNNVLLEGAGGGGTQNVDPDINTAATAFLWIGAAGGTMYDMGPTVAAAHKVQGGGITKLYFEGDGIAGKAVNLRSVVGGRFDFVHANTTVAGLDIDVEDTVTADPPDTQNNLFSQVTCNNAAAGTGICVRLRGGTSSDSSINKFSMLRLLHKDGDALDVGQSGGNIFEHVYVVRTGGGVGTGVLLRAGTSPDLVEKTVFVYVQPGQGGLVSQGLASGSTAATNNTVLYYSRANASPAPVVQLGSSLNFWDSLGNWRMSRDSTFPILDLHRSTSSTGQIGKYNFLGYNSSSAEVSYANIGGFNNENTAGAEDGELRIVTKVAGSDVTQATIIDGWKIGTPTGGNLGLGTLNIDDRLLIDGSSYNGLDTPAYSANIAIDQRAARSHIITPTDGAGFTIGNPTSDLIGDMVIITIKNTFGVLGAATFNANYKLGAAWTQPANGFQRSIGFLNDGTNLHEIWRSAADVTN